METTTATTADLEPWWRAWNDFPAKFMSTEEEKRRAARLSRLTCVYRLFLVGIGHLFYVSRVGPVPAEKSMGSSRHVPGGSPPSSSGPKRSRCRLITVQPWLANIRRT